MLLVFVLILAALLLLYIARGFLRVGSFNMFVAVGMVVVLAVTGWVEFRWTYGAQKADHLLIFVSDNPDAQLKCQRMFPALIDIDTHPGYVKWDEPNKAVVKFAPCKEMNNWFLSDKESFTVEQVHAFSVLAHEGMHVAGERNEAAAECLAQGRFVEMMKYAGASQGTADAMFAMYLKDVYPNLPSKYRMDCRLL